ncbi:CBO0543 family protein [Lentibacillus jeotgali]|uniref:CBO0543 family protein n=1 Tax=Lentibacillus jeotgali TaxID=558169 RepID=UPI0002625873|nr:CBO0543 family protein [Lentibacillus jeotgali]
MEIILLWLFLILGIILLTVSLKKQPLKDWLLCLLAAAYFASPLGDLVVKYEFLSYPVQLFPQFQSSILYEYLLLPLMCLFYFQSTYHKGIFSCIWQAFLYSAVLTTFEVLLEIKTALIDYIHWGWFSSFITQFLFLLFIRWLMWLVNVVVKKREKTVDRR